MFSWRKEDDQDLGSPFLEKAKKADKNGIWPSIKSFACSRHALVFFCVTFAGVVLGLVLPPSSNLPKKYKYISNIIGYTYFVAWSISFYPQVWLNWCRKSTRGLSFDFEAYNFLGFLTYSVFNLCFYFVPAIQDEYRKTHDGNDNKVALNDVCFAVHALIITVITIMQMRYYDRYQTRASWVGCLLLGIGFLCIAGYAGGVLLLRRRLTWLGWLYFLSYVKMAITVVKYIPQAYLNYRRRSTAGWSIGNVLLDALGGLLSVLQLILDCHATGDWGGITGDPVKFGLGFVSIFFDVIFMLQHYILFPQPDFRYYEKKADVQEGNEYFEFG